MAATVSRLDFVYRSILLSKFFVKGWGDPENMKKIFKFRKIISNRETCQNLVKSNHPIYIDRKVESNDLYKLYDGHFYSPLVDYLPNLVPEESHVAYFQLMIPSDWDLSDTKQLKPICVQLAGTGDHGFFRRRNFMARPLIKDYGIGSIILENPFYGLRKPKNQSRSQLNNVSDIFIMGGCLILESLALFHWTKRMGYGPLCITGISMGGHNASLAATNWHEPIAVVPCLSWTTASYVFTQGVMSEAIPWKILESHYLEHFDHDREEFQKLIHSPETIVNNEMFDAGRSFAQNFYNFNHFLSELNMSLSSYLEKIITIDKENKFFNKFNRKQVNPKQNDSLTKQDALDFMRGIMDECTHLGNFSQLVDPELAIIINARHDGYVPAHGVIPLTQIWPGSTVRYLDRGHVSAILFDSNEFRKAIADSLELLANKHLNRSILEI